MRSGPEIQEALERSLRSDRTPAVAAAYGWPASVAQDTPELVRRLTELNRQIIQGERSYTPFGAHPDPL